VLSAETYSLDSASNLSSKTVDSLTTSYTYDAINQLLTESNTGYSSTYTYDANGNRASQALNGTTYSYSYDSGDKLSTFTSGGTTVKSFAYDGAGRTHTVTTSAGTTTLSYDYEDRVTGITYPSSATNSFTYNGLDTRVGKVDSTGTSTYKRDGADVTDPVLSDGSIAYTPGPSERKSSTTTFDHGNYLGTFTRQTNSSETTTATRVYDAYGNLESTTGTPLSPFGFADAVGYQEDGDSGLKLLGHRYYDPSTGRFVTRDPSKDGRNWYAYCSSDPTFGYDPTGLISWWKVISGAIGIVTIVPIVLGTINAMHEADDSTQYIRTVEHYPWKDRGDGTTGPEIAESLIDNEKKGSVPVFTRLWTYAWQYVTGRMG
jgi:RHS repeat-associated protein